MDFTGFVIIDQHKIWNPITGESFAEVMLPRRVEEGTINNTGTFKTTRFFTVWHRCVYIYKDLDCKRTNWEECNSLKDEIENFIISKI